MNNILKISYRNLKRNHRRTLLTSSLITLGVVFVLVYSPIRMDILVPKTLCVWLPAEAAKRGYKQSMAWTNYVLHHFQWAQSNNWLNQCRMFVFVFYFILCCIMYSPARLQIISTKDCVASCQSCEEEHKHITA